MKKFIFLLFTALLFIGMPFSVKATDGSGSSWTTKYEREKCFIENKGQFHLPGSDEKVEYAYDNSSTRVYFTKKGLTYSFIKIWPKEEEQGEKEKDTKKEHFQSVRTLEDWKKKEAEEHKPEFIADFIDVEWENANPDVQILAEQPIPSYFSYTFKDKSGKHIQHQCSDINFCK